MAATRTRQIGMIDILAGFLLAFTLLVQPACNSSKIPGDILAAGCPAPYGICDGKCVDLLNDKKNCGECGATCGGNACVEGACQCAGASCKPGASCPIASKPY